MNYCRNYTVKLIRGMAGGKAINCTPLQIHMRRRVFTKRRGSDSPLCQLTEFGYWISFRGGALFVYLTI